MLPQNQLLYHLIMSAMVVALGNAPSESEDNGFTVRFASLTRYATFGLSGWTWTNNLVNPNHAPYQIGLQIELANRIGFEPMADLTAYDELATRCFKPLSHLFWWGDWICTNVVDGITVSPHSWLAVPFDYSGHAPIWLARQDSDLWQPD